VLPAINRQALDINPGYADDLAAALSQTGPAGWAVFVLILVSLLALLAHARRADLARHATRTAPRGASLHRAGIGGR
jgi:hypothetical protein